MPAAPLRHSSFGFRHSQPDVFSATAGSRHLPARNRREFPRTLDGNLSLVPPEAQILQELLASDSGFVSGTSLAKGLGISRVSVWSHMEKMRADGFVFEAVRRRGYRLITAPNTLHPWLVQAHLRLKKPAPLVWCESVDSTNSEAERQLAAGREAPFIVLARRQSSGRGRLGRQWQSEDSGNIYVSCAFRPNLEPSQLQTFTLWMGLNVCDCVANACRIQPQVKWPNDLLYKDRKLGGMLTEARIDADHTRDLIFGLGLNVNTDTRSWPADVAARATCLRDASGGEVDLNHLASAAISRVLTAYDRFVEGGHRESFAAQWRLHDALAGRDITLQQGQKRISGRACGIADDGSLVLRLPDGTSARFRAGEVSLGSLV